MTIRLYVREKEVHILIENVIEVKDNLDVYKVTDSLNSVKYYSKKEYKGIYIS